MHAQANQALLQRVHPRLQQEAFPMSATAVAQSAAAQVAPLGPQAIQTLDYLADLFLHLERKASEAYDAAAKLDVPAEQLKDKLIFLAGDLGSTEKDGSRVLRGTAVRDPAAFRRIELLRSC